MTLALVGSPCLAGALAAGCGTSEQNSQAQRLQGVSVLSATAPLRDRLITRSEVTSASDADAVRTFLQLWSRLQFRAWDQAVALIQPALREAIGPALLTGALAGDVIVWQATKPKIISASVTGGTAVITFVARDEGDHLLPAAISFQRAEGGWRVSYFSLLDGAVARAVQLRAQAQLEPLATKPNAEAVRQGQAAGAIQSVYLERQLRSSPRRGGAGVP
jgi:hypothetical protein